MAIALPILRRARERLAVPVPVNEPETQEPDIIPTRPKFSNLPVPMLRWAYDRHRDHSRPEQDQRPFYLYRRDRQLMTQHATSRNLKAVTDRWTTSGNVCRYGYLMAEYHRSLWASMPRSLQSGSQSERNRRRTGSPRNSSGQFRPGRTTARAQPKSP